MTEPTPSEQYQVVDRNTTGPRAVFVNLDAILLREVEAERDLLLAQNTTLREQVTAYREGEARLLARIERLEAKEGEK